MNYFSTYFLIKRNLLQMSEENTKLSLRQFARPKNPPKPKILPTSIQKETNQKSKNQRNLQLRNGDQTLNGDPILNLNKVNTVDTPPESAILINQDQIESGRDLETQSMNESSLDDDLKRLYTEIRSIPNYSAKLAEFLRQNDVHSKHRRIVKKKFPRRHIIVHFPYQIFMGDLIEYQRNDFKYANNGNKFILVLIDVFTKKAYARPVKRKNKFDMSLAMNSILQNLDHYPNTLITDEGLVFYNKNVEQVLDNYAIHHYSIKTKMKASVVERFIRTLKSRLEKYVVKNNTKRWVDVLPQLIQNYNNTPHRTIGMSPNQVTDDNADKVFKKMFPEIHLEAKPRLHVGDQVRKLKEKTIFDKGYKQSWSDELYQIAQVKQAAGRIWYIISDLDGNRQSGIKYYWELNLVRNA